MRRMIKASSSAESMLDKIRNYLINELDWDSEWVDSLFSYLEFDAQYASSDYDWFKMLTVAIHEENSDNGSDISIGEAMDIAKDILDNI